MARGLAGARLKLGMAVLLGAAALTAGAGLLAHQVRGTTQQEAGPEDAPRPAAGRTEGDSRGKGRQVRVDRDGLPLPAGAIARLGSLRLYHGEKEVRRLEGKDGMVYAPAFAPDGRTIAAGGKRKAAHLWDVATGRELRSFDNPGGLILCLAFAPDGKVLATRGFDER
jgi:hypothetical protein